MKNVVMLFGITPIVFFPISAFASTFSLNEYVKDVNPVLLEANQPMIECALPGPPCSKEPTIPSPQPSSKQSSLPFDPSQCYTEEKKNITIKVGQEFCIKLDKFYHDQEYLTEWLVDTNLQGTEPSLELVDEFSFLYDLGGKIETIPNSGTRPSIQVFRFKATLPRKETLLFTGNVEYNPVGTPDFSRLDKPSLFSPEITTFNTTIESTEQDSQQPITTIKECIGWTGCEELTIYSNNTYVLQSDNQMPGMLTNGSKTKKQGQLPERYSTQLTNLRSHYGSFNFHIVDGCGLPCDGSEAWVSFRGNGNLSLLDEKKKEISQYLRIFARNISEPSPYPSQTVSFNITVESSVNAWSTPKPAYSLASSTSNSFTKVVVRFTGFPEIDRDTEHRGWSEPMVSCGNRPDAGIDDKTNLSGVAADEHHLAFGH